MDSGDVLRRVLLHAFMRGMRIDEAAALFRVPDRTLRLIRQSAKNEGALPLSLRDAIAMERGSRTRRRMCSAEQQALERWFRSVLPVHSGDPYNRPRQYESDYELVQRYERELDTIIGDVVALRAQPQYGDLDLGPAPDERLLHNISAWYFNRDPHRIGPPRTLVPRSAEVIHRLLRRVLHVRRMRESWGEFDCKRCVSSAAAEQRRATAPQPGDDALLLEAAVHKRIRRAQQQSYYEAWQLADGAGHAGCVVTQDFTSLELGANVSASPAERADAKVRALIMAIETGDKQHHYRVFLCTGAESESSDFFMLRAAWYQLLGGPGAHASAAPIDLILRSSRRIDVWSDGASGQFKQRYALMMFCNLSRATGIRFRVNFFAPGHGHSLADACAARFKQAANRLQLGYEGSRAAGLLFSVASPTLLHYAQYATARMRNTTVSLLGTVDRSEALRPSQRPLGGMKKYFSFAFGNRDGCDYVLGSETTAQQHHNIEWPIASVDSVRAKRPRVDAADEDEERAERKQR